MTTAFLQNNLWLLIVAVLWILPWKGYALWTAARASHKKWFIALLILNTFAILEIVYIFYVARKTPRSIAHTVKETFHKTLE